MGTAGKYDAIVIGSGQGGTPLSRTLAERLACGPRWSSERTSAAPALTKAARPTKTVVASARVAYPGKARSRLWWQYSENIQIDLKRVRQRKRNIVDSFRNGSQARSRKTPKLDLIFGTASFDRAQRNRRTSCKDGGTRTLRADRVIINAGTRTAIPDSPASTLFPISTTRRSWN